MAASGGLFLGRKVSPESGKTTSESLLFDPDDLTTHGLIVGMTGSGKTALGIVLIEERWATTPYSHKEGERFAELFALGHFGLQNGLGINSFR